MRATTWNACRRRFPSSAVSASQSDRRNSTPLLLEPAQSATSRASLWTPQLEVVTSGVGLGAAACTFDRSSLAWQMSESSQQHPKEAHPLSQEENGFASNSGGALSLGARPPPPAAGWWSCAHLVVQLFIALAICAMDRSILSLLIIPMAAELNWRLSVEGFIMASLFAGYMTTGIIAGRMADASGGKRVLAAGVVVWSLMTALTPVAARYGGLKSVVVVRFLLGCGEGSAMPAMNSMVQAGVPERLISRALAFIYSGMYVGSVLGLVLTPPLMRLGAGSWEIPFYVFGAVGMAWTLFFAHTVEDLQPKERAGRRSSTPGLGGFALLDADDDAGDAPDEDGDQDMVPSLVTLLREKAVLAILFAHFTATTGFFIMVVWLPTFLVSRFNTSVSRSAALSVAPYAVMFFTSNLSGYGADRLIGDGVDTTRVRKIMQTIGFLGPSVFLVITIFTTTALTATICVTCGLGLHAFSHAGVYCNHQDISSGKSVAGVLLGLSNTVASVPGVLGVAIAGLVADFSGENWNLIFMGTVAQYLLGTAVYLAYGSSAELF